MSESEKTQAVKVTLRPKQIKKIKEIAEKEFDGNFSLALRSIVNNHEDNKDIR